jgi:enamine deaminase RidA (YjgF/YER057c/UK114 family)
MVQRFDVGARLSEMAIHNGVVYLAGQIPEDPNLDIEGQTLQVLQAIDRLLERAGTDKRKLLMVQIFLVDLKDFEGMNRVWDQWVVPGHTAPRATVQANLASPKWRLEVVATAAL